MAFKALKSIKPINPIGRILGVSKDRYGKNMAIEPEKFEKKFRKFESGDKNTGADFMKIADELDDEQLSTINQAYKQKDQANEALRPFGLHNRGPQDAWLHWRTSDIATERKEGNRKEKNPRK